MSWTKVLPQPELPAGARKVARHKARHPWSPGGRPPARKNLPDFSSHIDTDNIWINLDDNP